MKSIKRWSVILTLLVLVGLLFIANPISVFGQEDAKTPEVEPELLQQIQSNDSTGYLIYFREKADLSPAYKMDWDRRGQYVIDVLQATAQKSQGKVIKYLDAQKADYQVFWIENVIAVNASNMQTFNGLMNFPEIEALKARRMMGVIEPTVEKDIPEAVLAVEPNIGHVLAPDVWGLGVTGSGIVVANVDTGVRFTHEALVRQYRGTTTGSHDYNWLGAAGGSTTPLDDHGHGTHTMGTIVGQDATLTNQIGMAPGAQWIACDACESTGCPDAALLTCAQWIAAPYPVGDPGSPNPAMRPQVVNNSWGDCSTSYDDWYQASVDAWQAAGIYPVFSNGNASNCGYSNPPGLNTVGNLARYGNVTGVGSSGESNGQYASHSNWGPTDNLDTINPVTGWADLKPQVLAPGVSIRSSVPTSDSSYEDGWSGTSMSAPHVTGLVALMWQAGSCLLGDYATTETIIEQTATPIYYDDGSGSRWPNYASGWGEIDALAAVEQAMAMCGPTGTLAGTVTASAGGAPLSDVTIVATDNVTATKTTQTDSNGEYGISFVPEGTYTMTASLFGYLPEEVNNVGVYSGTTTTVDFALDLAPSATISGYVTDANTGWPLYASIDVEGTPLDSIWTNPETGYYNVVVPQGSAYTFTVNAFVDGYLPEVRSVGPVSADATEDFVLDVDVFACVAPGYEISGGFVERFDSVTPSALPTGWIVEDVNGTSGDWLSRAGTRYPSGYSAHSVPNLVYFNSYNVSSGGSSRLYYQNTIDMNSLSTSDLGFWMFRDNGYSSSNDYVQIQVSTDSGSTWLDVGPQFTRYSAAGNTWEEKSVDLSAYSTETDLLLGFLAVSGYGNDIHIDDIVLGGTPSCLPSAGGLVVGNVYDENLSQPLTGAKVENADGSSTTTVDTPDDPNVDDSFYTLFAPVGSQTVTATMSAYGPDVTTLSVVDGTAQTHDFYLPAGMLESDPESIHVTIEMGISATVPLTLSNLGGVDTAFELIERNKGYMLTAGENVLVVSEDNDAAAAMESALTTLGHTYMDVESAAFTSMSIDDLLNYRAVFYAGIPSQGSEQAQAIAYMDAGGNFYVSDNDIGFNYNGTLFYNTYLQATYVSDDPEIDALIGEDIMAGVDPDISDDPYPDDFTVSAEGVRIFQFEGGNAAGVAVDRNGYLAVYTSFDFDTIASVDDEVAVINRIMGYFISDVPWLSTDPITGTVPALNTATIDVTLDASVPEVTQPGDYLAKVVVKNDAPYGIVTVPVTMTVTAPAIYGLLEGTVTSLGYCDVNPVPAVGATVLIEATGGMSWTLTTDDSGYYGLYLDEAYSPVSVTVSIAGHESDSATGVTIAGQTTTTEDFDLRVLQPCVAADPAALDVTVVVSHTATEPLMIENAGAMGSNWSLAETPLVMLVGTPVTKNVNRSVAKQPLSHGSQFIAYATLPNAGNAPQDLINDGSFEADPAIGPWTEVDSTGCTPWIGDWSSLVGVSAYDGSQYFWAGGGCGSPNDNSAYQTITIPSDYTRLSFWYYAMRSDPDDPTDNGLASVKINGASIWSLEMSQANNTTGWVNQIVDISSYSGQSITLTFQAVQGNSGIGNVFFDQVETLLPDDFDVPWLSEDPITGTLDADSVAYVAVNFDATGLSAGQYTAALRLTSDDPMNPIVQIPVTLTVITEYKIYLPLIFK